MSDSELALTITSEKMRAAGINCTKGKVKYAQLHASFEVLYVTASGAQHLSRYWNIGGFVQIKGNPPFT